MQNYIISVSRGIVTSPYILTITILLFIISSFIFLRKKNILTKSLLSISTAAVILDLLFLIPGNTVTEIVYGNNIASFPLIRIVKAKPKSNKAGMQTAALTKEIANAYGIDAFGKVDSIHYTFNVDFNGKIMSRSWEWHPKTKEVTYWGKNKNGKEVKVSYNEHNMDGKVKKIDAKFINDNYWLLFPFHLVWDTNVKFKDMGMKKYPIGRGMGRALMVEYADNVGYTPGDHFELFLGKNNMIKQWIYFHHGSTKHPFAAVWTGNKNYDGFTISTMHYGSNKKIKLWFSNIKVSLAK